MDRMGLGGKDGKIPSGQSASVLNRKIITFSITGFQKMAVNPWGTKVLATSLTQKLHVPTINTRVATRQTYKIS